MNELVKVLPIFLGAILGYLCALGAKGLGQKVAVTRHTITTSVIDTIERQVRLFGKAGLAAILLLIAAAGLVVFTPSTGTSWAPLLGKAIGFCANIALGFAAGVGTNVVRILSLPGRRDSLDCVIEMKRRTRRRLKKFLSILLLGVILLSAATGLDYAGEATWVLAIDRTASVDPVQRETGINGPVESAYERAHKLKVTVIQVVRFDEGVMLSDIIWIPVPPEPVAVDCRKAEPAPVMEEGFITIAPGLAMGRKERAVLECLGRQRAEREAQERERRAFQEKLEAATKVTPRADVTTRILPLIQWLAERPGTRAIDIVTDGIDHSGMPLSSLKIPEQVTVTMIITRPNPARAKPSLDDVLAAARAWARVPGISVMGVGEYPGLWTALRGGRS